MSAAPASGRDAGRSSGLLNAAREIARDIKLSHSVFALPFAALGAVYAATAASPARWNAFLVDAALILACMVSARTAAMIANRILDRQFDARNPRTAQRAIPAGRLPLSAAITSFILACAIFIVCTAGFGVADGNWWPLWLSIPVLAWISAYALLKRFTALCHLWLGASLAISPPAAALAVNLHALTTLPPWLMSGMVLCWVAGFDIIYALQDQDVDRREGLHSIPSKLGTAGALWCARGLHAAALAFLFWLWRSVPEFGVLFGVAAVLAAALLVIEHATVHKWGTTKIAATFTLVNGGISVAVGTAGVIELLLSRAQVH